MALLTAGAMALAAGASLASGLINTGVNIWSQKDQQQFNAEEALKQREFSSAEAQKARDWQEYMSNTNYQRMRADMEAAGYNPASIGMVGSSATPAASIPSAYAAQGSSNRPGSFTSSYFTNLVSNAMQLELQKNPSYLKGVIRSIQDTNAKEVAELQRALYKATKNPIYDENGGFRML